ncbi:hypothetical protein A8C56_10855 [Niabella ginsenosidivorans]|uniref:PPM-type phosphatase domain-containing protein n=1 Tax=Niabella ginsenosidivorans TaxID=1176587 RepID=A0A1A9I1B8_9BACT|nr:hypothetical protein [Niabella ginsenosidivorans]ANH81416.1 hypothetical protein A8C56_10855 [Niabella ginsenosidivorans]
MFFRKNNIPAGTAALPELPVVCDAIAISDKGPLRTNNEDTYLLIRFPAHNGTLLAMVADGMGGIMPVK